MQTTVALAAVDPMEALAVLELPVKDQTVQLAAPKQAVEAVAQQQQEQMDHLQPLAALAVQDQMLIPRWRLQLELVWADITLAAVVVGQVTTAQARRAALAALAVAVAEPTETAET